jgi:hypothetical protein
MNRKKLFFILTLFLVLVMFGSCASSEERAAQKADYARKVKVSLDQRVFKISVNRMIPMSGSSRSVSYGYSVEVKNDSLFSNLPYFGKAYQVPYGGGKGLTFNAPISHYQESQKKNGARQIDIEVKNDEDTYSYQMTVYDNGSSSINVQGRQREGISYSGEVVFDSK